MHSLDADSLLFCDFALARLRHFRAPVGDAETRFVQKRDLEFRARIDIPAERCQLARVMDGPYGIVPFRRERFE